MKASPDAVDRPELVATRDGIVTRNHRGVRAHLAQAGRRVVRGSARVTRPRAVRAQGPDDELAPGVRDFAARRGIVLATGSRPRTLPGLEPDGRRVVTSDDSLFAPGLPGSVLVLGGGAIGVEYSSFHGSMAAQVALGEAADRTGPLEDADVSRHLTRGLKRRGIDVQAGARLPDAELLEDGVRTRVRTAHGEPRTVEAERLLVAVGRIPVTAA